MITVQPYSGSTELDPRYEVDLYTPSSGPSTLKQVVQVAQLLQGLVTQFGAQGQAVVNAIGTDPGKFLTTLTTGLGNAVEQFVDDLPTTIQQAVVGFLGLQNVNSADLTTALLQYAGLTMDNIKGILVQAIGANNLGAINQAYQLVSGEGTTTQALEDFFTKLNQLQLVDANGNPLTLNFDSLLSQVTKAVESKLESALATGAAQLLAKFAPGLGVVSSLATGASFLLSNAESLAAIVQNFLNSLNALANGNTAAFEKKLLSIMNSSVPLLLKFAVSQLGLSALPAQIQSAVQVAPNTITKVVTAVVSKIASKLPNLSSAGNSKVFDGLLGNIQQFSYQGVTYDLWAAKEAGTAKVKVGAVAATGTVTFVAVLTAANFATTSRTNISALISAAQALAATAATVPPASKTKNQPLPPAQKLKTLTTQQATVNQDEKLVEADILAGKCTLLQGCFRAGEKLLTKRGWVAIEEIVVGDYVQSVSEFNDRGALEWKLVEETFSRTGRILEIVVESRHVIGTTPEHAFYVRSTNEWTEAGALVPGNELRTDKGWVKVEKIFDTERYEVVYNARIADFHTYFVGGENWGFGVWAHNTSCGEVELQPLDSQGRATGVVAILVPSMVRQPNNYAAFTSYPSWWHDTNLPNDSTLKWQRGHILASKLSGPGGSAFKNLVPLTTQANTDMKVPERIITNALTSGQTVLFTAVVHYTGNNYYPDYIQITAEGTTSTGGVGIRLNTRIYDRPLVNPS